MCVKNTFKTMGLIHLVAILALNASRMGQNASRMSSAENQDGGDVFAWRTRLMVHVSGSGSA
jgi:hypothetical protein